MKKGMILLTVGFFLVAGMGYAAKDIRPEKHASIAGIEIPDKDPRAKSANNKKEKCCSEAKDKSCCTSDKSCKKDGKSCESSKKADGKKECCSNKKTGTGAVNPVSKGDVSAAAEKTHCAKTKCQ